MSGLSQPPNISNESLQILRRIYISFNGLLADSAGCLVLKISPGIVTKVVPRAIFEFGPGLDIICPVKRSLALRWLERLRYDQIFDPDKYQELLSNTK